MITDKYFRALFVIAIVVILAIFAGCDKKKPGTQSGEMEYINGVLIYTLTYDSCEYVKISEGITHKGNCKFCKERK